MPEWKPNLIPQEGDDNEKKEADFLNHIHQILTDTHYTFLKDVGGLEFDNKFCWTFAGVLGALTAESKESMKGLDEKKFVDLLKRNEIRKVAEVGPGTYTGSMILPLHESFKTAGCEMFVIANDLSQSAKNTFNHSEIKVIEKEAGNLEGEKLNLDLIVAHNVFSLGGQFTARRDNDNPKKLIETINHGVIDLIHQLSSNPHASIVLVEQFDIMPLDRTAIAKEAKILSWEEWSTDNSWIYRQDDGLNDYEQYVKDVYSEAPNFAVLQKKSGSK